MNQSYSVNDICNAIKLIELPSEHSMRWSHSQELDNITCYVNNAKSRIIIMGDFLRYDSIIKLITTKATSLVVNVLLNKDSPETLFEQLYINNIDVRITEQGMLDSSVVLIDDTYTIISSKKSHKETINQGCDSVCCNNKETYGKFYNHYLRLIDTCPTYCYKEWTLHIFCKRNNVNKSNLCIVGSHLLQKLQIRKSNDIDFILTTKERDRLKLPRHNKSVTKYNEVVSYHWHPHKSDDELISNAELHTILPNEFKICTLKMLRDKKVKHNREKDIRDVKSIDAYFDSSKCI